MCPSSTKEQGGQQYFTDDFFIHLVKMSKEMCNLGSFVLLFTIQTNNRAVWTIETT